MTMIDPTQDGINRSEAGAKEAFLAEAYDAGLRVAASTGIFTTDEIWAQMPEGVATSDNRAMGSVMRRLASDGYIRKLPGYQATTRREAHRRPVQLWQSRVFGP